MKHLTRTTNNLGHAIYSARKARNWTQGELAIRSGVWQETISKIERGTDNTKLETVFAILAALDLELQVQHRTKASSADLEDIF
ncbi:MAG: helix-turn-helix domain-containing protein [Pseudomonadota bacterium]